MANYTATSINSRNFILTNESGTLGELIYPKWYTFNAEIVLGEASKYQLELEGFWDSKIQLKQGDAVLLEFKIGWNGVELSSNLDGKNERYLLKLKGFFSSKYVLVDAQDNEILEAEFDFKWKKLELDYNITTTEAFKNISHKEVLILTSLHCINYYQTFLSGM